MLNLLSSLIDLGLAINVLCLLVMYFRLKKSLKQTDRIVNYNADGINKFYSEQQTTNNELKQCLECLCNTVEELEKSKTIKKGNKKEEPEKIFKGTKNEQIITE